jgi:hypothetical protein|tara:strand:+ start:1703 stop:2143 length:441 start_codon:yes stop_codon:yes gene_type:complete
MKLDQLRQIIREEVRSAVKDELADVLTEAVAIASKPQQTYAPAPVKQKDLSRTWSTGKMNTATVPLEEMLSSTANSMTSDEYRNITGASGPSMGGIPKMATSMASQMGMTESTGPLPGLDLSKLPFVNKAKQVLDAAYEKDKQKSR